MICICICRYIKSPTLCPPPCAAPSPAAHTGAASAGADAAIAGAAGERPRRRPLKKAPLKRQPPLPHANQAGDERNNKVRAHEHPEGAEGGHQVLLLSDLAHDGEGDLLLPVLAGRGWTRFLLESDNVTRRIFFF
jgi:hypothetical protein